MADAPQNIESPSVAAAGRSHIRVLDGLRGVAILMVLLVHFYPKALIADSYPTTTMILGRIVTVGGYGVELFFVLSGFLITGILLDTKREKGFLMKFYARRILRIFPLYYGALIIVLLVIPALTALDPGGKAIIEHQIMLWTYMVNWPTNWIWDDSTHFLLGHFWSLCVEEHFYLFWPLLVAALPTQRILYAAASLILISLISRSIATWTGPGALPLFEWATLQKMDGLAIGAMLAIAVREPGIATRIPNPLRLQQILMGLLLLATAYVFLPRRLSLPIFHVIGETLMVIFFGVLLLASLQSRTGGLRHRILGSTFLVSFGKYSYGLYVIHGILRPVFSRLFDMSMLRTSHGLPFLYLTAYYIVTITFSFGLAYISFHLFEKHFLNLKRYFEYETPGASTPVPLNAPAAGVAITK